MRCLWAFFPIKIEIIKKIEKGASLTVLSVKKTFFIYILLFLATTCFGQNHVFDEAGIFGVGFEDKINTKLKNLYEKNGENIFVVSLKTAYNSPSLAQISKTEDKKRILIVLFPTEKKVYLGFSNDLIIRFARTREAMPITQKKLSNAVHEGIKLYIFDGKYEKGVEQILAKIEEFFPYKQKREQENVEVENGLKYVVSGIFISLFICLVVAFFFNKLGRLLLSICASGLVASGGLGILEYDMRANWDIHIFVAFAITFVIFVWVQHKFVIAIYKKKEQK